MIKYKDASKDQSSLIPLNTLFFATPCMRIVQYEAYLGPEPRTKWGVSIYHFHFPSF